MVTLSCFYRALERQSVSLSLPDLFSNIKTPQEAEDIYDKSLIKTVQAQFSCNPSNDSTEGNSFLMMHQENKWKENLLKFQTLTMLIIFKTGNRRL